MKKTAEGTSAMNYLILPIFIILSFACAKRPDSVDAGDAYSKWLAAHPDEETDDPAEAEPDNDEPYEIEEDIDNYDPPNDPDLPEGDSDLAGDDIIDEDMVDTEPDLLPDADIDTAVACDENVCTDPVSGLVWQRNANYSGPQGSGASFCGGLADFGGHTGWKLPTIDELKTLRRGCTSDAGCADEGTCYWDTDLMGECDKGHWSSSGATGTKFYAVEFATGKVVPVEKETYLFVRCVVDNN